MELMNGGGVHRGYLGPFTVFTVNFFHKVQKKEETIVCPNFAQN